MTTEEKKLIVYKKEWQVLKDFVPEWNEPTGDSETMEIDWNTLMSVVEKINTIAIDNYGEMGVWVTPVQCFIGENEHDPLIMTTKGNHPVLIDMVWAAVVTFIHWYNKTTKP